MAALWDGLMMGVGLTWALVLLGGVREVLGAGTLFANANLLLGEQFAWIYTVVFEDYTSVHHHLPFWLSTTPVFF